MPKGLLNILAIEEILDLLAFLESRGKPGAPAFKEQAEFDGKMRKPGCVCLRAFRFESGAVRQYILARKLPTAAARF